MQKDLSTEDFPLPTLEPALGAETPTEVFYQEGLDGKPVKISIEKLKEKIPDFELSEDLWVPKELALAFAKARAERAPRPDEKEVLDLAKNPTKDVVICDTRNQKLGRVLLAGRTFEVGELALLYTGELRPFGTYGESDCYETAFSIDNDTSAPAVTPYRKGGRARFLSDLPYDAKTMKENKKQIIDALRAFFPEHYSKPFLEIDEACLKNRNLDKAASYNRLYNYIIQQMEEHEVAAGGTKVSPLTEEIKSHPSFNHKQLALANLTRIIVKVFGLTVQAFRVTTRIPQGHIMGWVYSERYDYWKNKGLPYLVTKAGKMIDKSHYHFLPKGPHYQNMVAVGKKVAPTIWMEQTYEQGISAWEAKDCADAQEHFRNALDCWESGMLQADELKTDRAPLEAKFTDIAAKLDPTILYNRGVALFKDKHYELAVIALTSAQEKFSAKNDKKSEDLCRSALSSCHKKLKKKETLEPKKEDNLSLAVEAAVSGAGSFSLNPKPSTLDLQVGKFSNPSKTS